MIMNRILILLLVFSAGFVSGFGQNTITGNVVSESGETLIGAHVEVFPGGVVATTDSDGFFEVVGLENNTYRLVATYLGYKPFEISLDLEGDINIQLELRESAVVTDELVVEGVRATENSATTYTNLGEEDIAKNNTGQDLPFLLQMTPSAVITSDAGHGIGYTGMRIRGSDGTRINATINGIPLNNAESQGAFWVNLPDFLSSVNSLQIQRGVGTSTNGAGAFGASVNLSTNSLKSDPYIELNNGIGSFNSIKNTVSVGSGLINDQFVLDARLSRISSDGYIDRASSDLKSYYLSGGWYKDRQILRFNIISGKEKTYQAWNGVPEDKLDTDRTFNEFTYEDQTDNYTQTHYQVHYSRQLTSRWNWNLSLNYTPGEGYYEEYKEGEAFSGYNLTPISIGDSIIDQTDLIRRRWLDNHFYGFTTHTSWYPTQNLDITAGGGFFQYSGLHFGEIVWAKYAADSEIYDRYYENDALKNDGNIYLKANLEAGEGTFYGDLQLRSVYYSFLGLNRNGESVEQDADLLFFNPKVGYTHTFNPGLSGYISLAKATREPNRDDYTESSPESRPEAEKLYNLETGVRGRSSRYQYNVNFYYMHYIDQLVLTGKINDVGGYVRSNVDDSYRMGIEADGAFALSDRWQIGGNVALSRNKIKNYEEYLDEYDVNFDYLGQERNVYENTDIAFSPSFIGAIQANFKPLEKGNIRLEGKYVSRQYLDNTSSVDKSIDPFWFTNLRLDYTFEPKTFEAIQVALDLNNIFATEYETNGYTYGYIYNGSREDFNFYYPQARFHFMLSLNVKL